MERRRVISRHSIAAIFVMAVVFLQVLGIASRARARDALTSQLSGDGAPWMLAHAGHELQALQGLGEPSEQGLRKDQPKGYPQEESDPPASSVRKLSALDGSKAPFSYLPKGDLSLTMILFALGSALFLGSAHALSPGHGKTMVAAYLVGSSGSRRDAVLLGAIVTFTHVISVLVLGLLCLLFSKHVVSQKVFPWIGAASGAVIFAVGYWMLARRALGLEHAHSHHGHDHGTEIPHQGHGIGQPAASSMAETTAVPDTTVHHHHHGPGCDSEHHDHPHAHEHAPRGHITMGSLVSLGLAGGMVPCPTALVILLSAISLGRVGIGLLLIVCFSLGLAAVLIVIGLLTVTASGLSDRFSASRKWVQILPVFSAGVVMVVGIAMAFNSLVAGGILSINR